jgi:hypothetical protein
VIVLVILLVPVAIGVFLLAMERLEFELLGTTPTAGSRQRAADAVVGWSPMSEGQRANHHTALSTPASSTPGACWPASNSMSRAPA